MQKVFLVAVLAIGLLLISLPMFAHHGTGISYDATKPMTINLTVTEFRYANPHPQLYGDAQGAGGKVEHWATLRMMLPHRMRTRSQLRQNHPLVGSAFLLLLQKART